MSYDMQKNAKESVDGLSVSDPTVRFVQNKEVNDHGQKESKEKESYSQESYS